MPISPFPCYKYEVEMTAEQTGMCDSEGDKQLSLINNSVLYFRVQTFLPTLPQ